MLHEEKRIFAFSDAFTRVQCLCLCLCVCVCVRACAVPVVLVLHSDRRLLLLAAVHLVSLWSDGTAFVCAFLSSRSLVYSMLSFLVYRFTFLLPTLLSCINLH